MRADFDLPWYFTQAAGDMGLRSPLGAQLELMRARQLVDGRTVDASIIEDQAHKRLVHSARIRRIEATLALVAPHHVAALRLHYSGPSWPFGVDPAATLLPWSESVTGPGGSHPQDLRGALHEAPEGIRVMVRRWADDLVAEAMAAYEAACRGNR